MPFHFIQWLIRNNFDFPRTWIQTTNKIKSAQHFCVYRIEVWYVCLFMNIRIFAKWIVNQFKLNYSKMQKLCKRQVFVLSRRWNFSKSRMCTIFSKSTVFCASTLPQCSFWNSHKVDGMEDACTRQRVTMAMNYFEGDLQRDHTVNGMHLASAGWSFNNQVCRIHTHANIHICYEFHKFSRNA